MKTQIFILALLVTVLAVQVTHDATLKLFAEQVKKKKPTTFSLILCSLVRKSSSQNLGIHKPVPEPSFHFIMQLHLMNPILSMGQEKVPKGSLYYYYLEAP